ncbi:hypothetical protein Bca52824_030829 [Brassica carinata]|uniref:Jacalin-type lectin domain-containing protein n=1 Tax=Brassica carinata TaxID=52824 RepID=A0A8X7S9V5_BRACI|nr:hypothetical protein Bca52824_030829 [Brassica carinata]
MWKEKEIMSKKVGAMGGNMGDAFDDGVFDGVKKITVAIEGSPFNCISYLKIEYEKDGKLDTREHGTIRGELKEFSVDYPNEYITSVGGSYDHVPYYETVLIKSLIFKTNNGKTSPVLGEKPAGTEFMLEGKNGGKLLGFFGRSGQALDAIGAYFDTGSLGGVAPLGGKNGAAFDDGVFEGVKKITVGKEGSPFNCISYIKIEYEKEGKFESREHGTIRGELQEFLVDYPNEYITSVGGSYDHVEYYETVLIKSLVFKTNTGKTSPVLGGTTAGTEFMLEGKNGGKLIGFFGFSGQALDAIGAYFGLPGGVGPRGGKNGAAFDDGIFIGVKKITVAIEGSPFNCISYIKIEYEKDRQLEIREHGTIRGDLKEFSVDYPNEYITSVGGSHDHVLYYETVLVKSLIFKTNTGRTSPVLGGVTVSGKPAGTEFLLEGKRGEKLLGFFGRSGQALDAIGAYFGPLGGIKGKPFDDGVFDGVKNITVGADEFSITYIKIEYEKDGKVEIREHGTNRGELGKFSVDYPKENITAIGGSYNHIFNYDTTLITSLYFTTSKGFTSPLFGKTKGTDFELKGENGEKLRGIYGRDGTAIDAIGAYF